jgi:hypothetical protein
MVLNIKLHDGVKEYILRRGGVITLYLEKYVGSG